MPSQHIDNRNDFQLERMHIDWTGLRTQTVIGLLAIFLLCLINFIPFWHEQLFGQKNGDCYDFFVYFASCLLVTLITLEIDKSSGNRIGAGYAIWAGLIFAVFPWQQFGCLAMAKVSRTISFLVLLMILILLRAQPLRNKIVPALFLLFCLCSLVLIKNIAIYCGDVFCCPFFRDFSFLLPAIREHRFVFYSMVWGYIFIGLTLSARVFLHTISLQTALRVIFCLLLFAGCEQLWGYPGMMILGGAALAIALVQCCLPEIEMGSTLLNRSYACLGLVGLILLAIAYEQQFLVFNPHHPFASTHHLGEPRS